MQLLKYSRFKSSKMTKKSHPRILPRTAHAETERAQRVQAHVGWSGMAGDPRLDLP